MALKVIAVVFSDLHLEIWKQHNDNNRRLKNAKDVLKKIALISEKYKAISLFCGDLFHKERTLSNDILEETLPLFNSIWGRKTKDKTRSRTLAITGNHDQSRQNTIDKPSPSYINTLSKIFEGLTCLDFKSELIDDVKFWGVPYLTHDIGLVDYLNGLDLKLAHRNVLMLHTTMPNAKDTDGREVHSNLKDTEFYKALKRFDVVFCGHIHSPFKMELDLNTTIVQVGAPQQQRLTDKNCDMGYWLLYSDMTVEFVPFKNYPKFIEIEDLSQKVDNKNFYVLKPKRKIQKERKQTFKVTNNKSRLAKKYLRERGIKDPVKKEALINALKTTE